MFGTKTNVIERFGSIGGRSSSSPSSLYADHPGPLPDRRSLTAIQLIEEKRSNRRCRRSPQIGRREREREVGYSKSNVNVLNSIVPFFICGDLRHLRLDSPRPDLLSGGKARVDGDRRILCLRSVRETSPIGQTLRVSKEGSSRVCGFSGLIFR